MFGSLWSYLKRRWMRIKGAFPILWKHYLYQSFLAAIVVFVILLILTIENAVVIASIGATAFIIFTMPRNITARPRRVIGGHMVGLLSGSLCALIPHSSTLASISVFALAVGISICLMVALDFEHPPASGTALGVAITGFSPGVIIAVVTSSIVLSLAHHFSNKFLKDLT
ncbi:MAG TPA: HPP family protein [Dehalococcoidales bacterium]|nr:HPP family protein [Dehalococcoidales bacterium]